MKHGVVEIAWALQLLRPGLSLSCAIDLSEALLYLSGLSFLICAMGW